MDGLNLTDYYCLLRVSPYADWETVERVYKLLRSRYGSTTSDSYDPEWAQLLEEAYRTLSDSEARSRYDEAQLTVQQQPIPLFLRKEFSAGIAGEPNRRMGLLCLLYDSRRANFEKPGISLLRLEDLTQIPREHLMFTLSYLRERDLVTVDKNSDFVITCSGMDFVEAHLSPNSIFWFLLSAGEHGRLHAADMPEEGSAA